MQDIREETEALLEDKPGLEDDIKNLLEIDAEGPWEFDEIPFDSGEFGELVSRGIADHREAGYRLVDRDAVTAAIDSETATVTETTEVTGADGSFGEFLPSLPRRTMLALGGLLVAAFLFRIGFMYPSVFRDGDIVLAGNDPYFYRFQAESLLVRFSGFAPAAFGELALKMREGDILFILVIWLVADLLGGTPAATGTVLAWYPVLAGVVSIGIVYQLATATFADRRAGLASVALLSVLPVHAFRTALGFGDHHAFDYLWLSLTALALVEMARATDDTTSMSPLSWSRRRWLAVVGAAVSVSVQVLAWRGGPLLLIPVAVYCTVAAAFAVRAGRSPVVDLGALVMALTVAGTGTLAVHLSVGFMGMARAIVPILLAAFCLVVVVAADLAHRHDVSTAGLLAAEALAGASIVIAALALSPAVANAASSALTHFEETGQASIAETTSIVSGGLGSIFGPVLFFGFTLFLALPYLSWVSWRLTERRATSGLVLCIYAWVLFLLSLVQVRFAGPASMFVACFAGLGFVHFANRLELTRPLALFDSSRDSPTPSWRESKQSSKREEIQDLRLPDTQTVAYLGILFLLIGGFGLIQGPIKMHQISVDEDTYRTATGIERYATAQHLEYPNTVVLTPWSQSRTYNYFVSGDPRASGYGYALEHYESSLSATAGDAVYRRHHNQVGFIVTLDRGKPVGARTLQTRLHRHLGSRADGVEGLGHFRLVAATAGGSRKAFQLVPGARITGTAAPNTSVSVTQRVSVGARLFTYNRTVTSNRYGDYGVTIPYPGRYSVFDRSVRIENESVHRGATVGTYTTHLPLDEGNGRTASDPVSGTTTTVGGDWVDGVVGSGLSLADEGGAFTLNRSADMTDEQSVTVTFWLRGDLGASRSQVPTVLLGLDESGGLGYGFWSTNASGRLGMTVAGTDGRANNFGIQQTSFETWTHVVGVVDGQANELRLYRNGTLVATETAPVGAVSVEDLLVGRRVSGGRAAVSIDDLRIYTRSLSDDEIQQLSTRPASGVS